MARPTAARPAAASLLNQHRPGETRAAVPLQAALEVSSPKDPAEKEADSNARKISRMMIPEAPVMRAPMDDKNRPPRERWREGVAPNRFLSPVDRAGSSIALHRQVEPRISSSASARPEVAPALAADIQSSLAGGSPLPSPVRRFMEPRFRADFGKVRIHTDGKAASLNRQLNAQAFALGHHIFFGKEKFQPEADEGRELIAHELTHTIQQGAVVQRSEEPAVTQRSPTLVQRLGLSDALDYFADKANLIPGFRMFTIILGVNPINMSAVPRSAANILRALIEIIPGGALITQALDNSGVFEKVGAWVEQQIQTLGLVGSAIKQAVTDFLHSLSWTDIFDLGGVWNRAKRIFTEPIDRIINFGKGLVTGIIKFVKEAILRPIAKLAEGTAGYDLLKAILGQDPITGEPAPRTAETIIGPILRLIGQEEIWQNMKKANAIPRAWAWFQGAMSDLVGFIRQIPSLFVAAFQALELVDIILVPRAFAKLVGVFGDFVGKFIKWAGNAVWNLLQIIFEVVAPGAIPYIKKVAGAFRSILKNPIGFVGNLVKAAKLGFQNFAANFGAHLKAGLIDWLTGSLPGVYIPKAFALGEIVKFVFSVLGISWQNIRQKLVKVVGEPAVKAMETGFDIVVTLVTQGPAAAWDKIKEQLSNLKDMVIGGITDFVVDMVVKKAVPKLISMFIPGAGFISAILSIYDTVMVFVEKLSKIAQAVKAFVDSIVDIANGVVTAAANKVETTLAGLLSLAISFLAGFIGLGKVADKVMGVINKVRATIDKAIDWLISWIVTMAKKLGKFVVQAGLPQDPNERLRLGIQAAVSATNRFAGKKVGSAILTPLLGAIKVRYGFQRIELVPQGTNWAIRGEINPTAIAGTRVILGTDKDTGEESTVTVVSPPKILIFEFRRFTANQNVSINEMTTGLQHHQTALNDLTVDRWLANIYFRPFLKGAIAAEERDVGRKELIQQLRKSIMDEYKERNISLSKSQLDTLIKIRARGTHASHDADAIAGGNIDDFDSLERGAVNSYIGSNWGRFRPELEAYAEVMRQQFQPKDREKVKMNFRLRTQFLN